MFNRPGGELVACRRLVAVADAWLVRRVEEFDLSSAVGVGGLTAAAGIAIRSASCQQPRVAALVGAAAAIGLCAVARRRHRPSDLRSSCSSCSSCCQSSALTHLTRRARIVRRAKQDTCSCKQLRERGWPPPRPWAWPPGGRPDRGLARRARPTTGMGAGEDG